MKAFYCDDFVLPLPPEHRFPMRKYALLRQRVIDQNLITLENMWVPDAATDAQILRCHDADYLAKMKTGNLSVQEIRRIGFPWSLRMVERSRRASGATIDACLAALTDGTAVNLAGGTHHACRDHGEGFCVFNDAAIAARDMQSRGLARRVIVIDCDVHQGNGTAQITADDPTIFTFSIHGEKNFPFRKFPSDLDIGLSNGVTDDEYLETLEEGLNRALFMANPDLAIYISGADPFIGDRLGKLCISKMGLAIRDELVIGTLHRTGLPVAIAMGGGYADNVDDIADIHVQTVTVAARYSRN
ncbi:MAG: histone deacetylase [Chitinophagaceae bacterium]|nr:histone deacetylase [Anaerolineae bacterium]